MKKWLAQGILKHLNLSPDMDLTRVMARKSEKLKDLEIVAEEEWSKVPEQTWK